jgi:hypothetical protein
VTVDGAIHGSGVSATDGDAFDAIGPGRECPASEAAFGGSDSLAVLGVAAVLAGSPLPRAVRGIWAVADSASPDSQGAIVVTGTAAPTSGEASGKVAACGFKDSGLVTTQRSSLISRPGRRHPPCRFPTQDRA